MQNIKQQELGFSPSELWNIVRVGYCIKDKKVSPKILESMMIIANELDRTSKPGVMCFSEGARIDD